MSFQETDYGYELKNSHFTVFFGNKNSTLGNLKEAYPNFQFLRLKQIHSPSIVESNHQTPDFEILADGHFTNESNLALCSITADCIPAFLFNTRTNQIAALHAGWRGVASQILPVYLNQEFSKGSKAEDFQIFIGPHIQMDSFEVGTDVRDQILGTLGPLNEIERKQFFKNSSTQDKYLLDLHSVFLYQMQLLEVPGDNIKSIFIDTFSDTRFHSYRRDKNQSGRQISFIVKQ